MATARCRTLRRSARRPAPQLGYSADFRQSNDTGELLEWIVGARRTHVGIVINPAIATRNEPEMMSAYLGDHAGAGAHQSADDRGASFQSFRAEQRAACLL